MALQDILNKINTDANQAAENLKAENDKKIAAISEESDKETKAVEALTVELSEKKYAEEKRLKVSLATLEQKNKLLSAKQALINQAFDKALGEIKALPQDKYKELLINALIGLSVRGDEEVILGAEGAKKLGDGFINDLNAAFTKNGKKGGLKLLSETREGVSGCVLVDGRKEIICTFEAIIAGKRKELEKEVISILFKE